MATQVEVVYPSTSAFSGSGQLDLGPFFVPDVVRLLRMEVRGKFNFQGLVASSSSVEANFQLWAVQWVPHTASPADCVTTADGPNWLVRQQTGTDETRMAWAPDTDTAAYLATVAISADWAGQLVINGSIDLWLSARAPTGVAIANMNAFASIRFWWQ